MGKTLEGLKPYEVLKHFESLSEIPRGSGNEKAVSDFLVNFAKNLGLEVKQDKGLNVIIRKDGTKGYENSPRVILQGHMDMVCEKNQGTEHDFTKDPIKLRIDGDYIYATDTTLGADNGIAVAYAMAILESNDIPHPPMEVVITTEEETGMGGVIALDKNDVEGRVLINIDSEEEGTLLVSCAGGLRTKVTLPIEWMDAPTSDVIDCNLRVRGLKGGHSGMDINKERGNSNKILGRFLYNIEHNMDLFIVSLTGGAKDNAIPREADAVIKIHESSLDLLKERVNAFNEILKNELKASDHGIFIDIEVLKEKSSKCMSKVSTEKAIKLLYLLPNGIYTMSMEIKGLVQSSTNLGVINTLDNAIEYHSAVRSSIGSLKKDIAMETKAICELVGAKLEISNEYPEWQYDSESRIRGLFQKVYKRMNGADPKIEALHAGLECGLFKEKFGKIDMISFGPNLYDVHTPNEHMSISSVERCWEYLKEVLKSIKEY